ncbi:hypothetical protein AGOR_G00121090 [Albula goreensis]|uniref:PX domain-containing protein n=1 Tax=Albula goreensis TaxID=1534307 RepID=A0A8T3DKY9_9TELE|nr:hypothetical protein AGOR_G00121090 [Albula goreensis]
MEAAGTKFRCAGVTLQKYRISIHSEGQSWNVVRCYKDFLYLSHTMKKKFPDISKLHVPRRKQFRENYTAGESQETDTSEPYRIIPNPAEPC